MQNGVEFSDFQQQKQHQQKSYRNIYIKLNCTIEEYLFNTWRHVFVCWMDGHFSLLLFFVLLTVVGDIGINETHPIRSTLKPMAIISDHFLLYKQQFDNRFLMAFLRISFFSLLCRIYMCVVEYWVKASFNNLFPSHFCQYTAFFGHIYMFSCFFVQVIWTSVRNWSSVATS